MNVTLHAIRQFWKLPEGKQFLSACFLVIGTLCTVIVIQDRRAGKAAASLQLLEQEKRKLTEDCGNEKLAMQRQCDSAAAARAAEVTAGVISELRERIKDMDLEKRKMDKALENARQISALQRNTHANMKRAIQELQPDKP